MNKQYRVGIIAATGAVGQRAIDFLIGHPNFKVTHLAASKESLNYIEAVKERGWGMEHDIPEDIARMKVHDAKDISSAIANCDFVFSTLDTAPAKELEPKYAEVMPVVSTSAAFRWHPFVPMVIPEVNSEHLQIIPLQQKQYGWKGWMVTKPNCSLQSYLTLFRPLIDKGYPPKAIVLATLQALSGAGRPGESAIDFTDNWRPYIGGEEEKTTYEPLKILGHVTADGIKNYEGLKISATCTRVNVTEGHGALMWFAFADKTPELEEIISIWENFTALPQQYNLPSAPAKPIIYRREEKRPQPKYDRDTDKGMVLTVGRLEKDSVFDYKAVGLSHNTKRGAAGGAILTAELLAELGYFDKK
jgi:aspartate-semialdehyde dehydrogenase